MSNNDYASDLQWAWDHLADEDVAKDSAPDGAAWFLWDWAKKSPDKFIPLVSRVLGKKDDERDAALKDDARRQLDLLEMFAEGEK